MAEILFRTFCARALFFAPAPVLAVFAAGRTTGVGVDVGEIYTFIVPVDEGHSMPASMRCIELGGRDVTDYLAGDPTSPSASGRIFLAGARRPSTCCQDPHWL